MGLSNYLPSSAIAKPGVCTSSTRPASPYDGQVIYETDTDKTLVWNGSAWVYLSTSTAGDVGLVKVVPTSVTNGTLSADGTVTIGNAVSVVSIFGAFSSLYRNYRVVWSVASQSAIANCVVYMNASASGTYYTSGMYMSPSSATINGYQFSAQNTAVVGVWQSGFGNATGAFDIQSPQLANRTFIQSQSGGPGYFWWGGSQIADTAQNVNLYFGCSAGTMTGGSIVVYGYRD